MKLIAEFAPLIQVAVSFYLLGYHVARRRLGRS